MYCLDDDTRSPCLADDIESFFHVTLYNGIRYLRHNCLSVQSFIEDFFDSFAYMHIADKYRCGMRKGFAMRRGKLCLNGMQTPILFYDDDGHDTHRLNDIFGQLMNCFRGRYAPKEKEKVNTSALTEEDRLYGRAALDALLALREPDHAVLEAWARKLDNHDHFLRLLDYWLDKGPWPTNDKVGDQLTPLFRARTAHWQKQDLNAPQAKCQATVKEKASSKSKSRPKATPRKFKSRSSPRKQLDAVTEADARAPSPPRPQTPSPAPRARKSLRIPSKSSGSNAESKRDRAGQLPVRQSSRLASRRGP